MSFIPDSFASSQFPEDYENSRRIPRVLFISSVTEELKRSGVTVETRLRQINEQMGKYRLMDVKLSQSKAALLSKIPEIERTTEVVKYLKKKVVDEGEDAEVLTSFALTETVFASARSKLASSSSLALGGGNGRKEAVGGTVHLWLGANVMCEYTYDDAIALLEKNAAAAKTNLANINEDLAWVRDQITVLEVNLARVYNHDVIERRKSSATQQSKQSEAKA